jgi:hypothetical protein
MEPLSIGCAVIKSIFKSLLCIYVFNCILIDILNRGSCFGKEANHFIYSFNLIKA